MGITKKKKLPIGVSDFQEIIEKGYYYVDKSLLIQELIDSSSKVFLITRPRRFGKTLNLSMLKCFFESHIRRGQATLRERETTVGEPFDFAQDKRSRTIFQDLKIWQAGEEYTGHYQKYPIIYLTFKDVKEDNWENCLFKMKNLITDEYKRHIYLFDSGVLSEYENQIAKSILSRTANDTDYSNSLKSLSNYLHQYYSEKVIILIDEYDTPIHAAYEHDYYQKAIDFFRTFFGAGLKDNSSLERGVITGILRVARENIFSGLNNIAVQTVLDDKFADKFGFTEPEVVQMLQDYELEEHLEEVKTWYNGYVFGDVHNVYNPWSILNYIEEKGKYLKPYWVNTSSNTLINTLLSKGDREVKNDLECLLNHEPISKVIHTNTVFSNIEKDSSHLWSFLLFSGYLKIVGKESAGKHTKYTLSIPNTEVEAIYEIFIGDWFSNNLPNIEIDLLIKSLLTGDAKTFGKILQKFVLNSMSYFDPTGVEPEKVYHAFVLGLLVYTNQTHIVKSNRESGFGRYDIMLIPNTKSDTGVIIELKKVDHTEKETLETACESALNQIEEKHYEAQLRELGVMNVLKYGIAFEGKSVLVIKA